MFTMPMSISLPSRASLKFWKKKSNTITITDYDPTYKTIYLGNILTPYAKGEGCTDKPLSKLWEAYLANSCRTWEPMELTVCSSGMKSNTDRYGQTEFWAYRITHCSAPKEYPGVFCWIYRHERPKMKQELKCHAALCLKPEQAQELTNVLKDRLALALQEFRREKLTRQKARLSLANAVYDCPSMPQRKLLLYRGSMNFRPPIEMSKIAPKLTVIEEDDLEDVYEALEVGTPSSDDDIYMFNSEASSLSSSPDEELFSRYLMRTRNSIGETSGSDEDLYSEDTKSNNSEETLIMS